MYPRASLSPASCSRSCRDARVLPASSQAARLDSAHGPCKFPRRCAAHTSPTRKAAAYMTEKTGKTFELTDRATGKSAQLPVLNGTIGPSVIDIAGLYRDLEVFTYDPGFGATAACDSRITYIDGDAGVLLYRGYPIEQLAEKSDFLEVCYLILLGELPTAKQLEEFTGHIRYHTMINESLLRFFNAFNHNAHPMAMVSGVVASMAAFYHDTMDIHNPRHREIFAHRIIAKIPTIAAAAHKHSLGQPFIYPL